MSLENVRWWRPFWFSQKSWRLSLRIVWLRVKVDVLSAFSAPEGSTVPPSATGNVYFSSLLGNITSLALSPLAWISDASISSSSSRSTASFFSLPDSSAYNTKPRNIPEITFFRNWWIRDWSCVDLGRNSTDEFLQPMRYFGKWQVAPYLLMVHISKGFRFLVGLNDGWPRACSSALSHSTDSGIGVEPLLLSCCDDVGGVVPYEFDEEEVVDKPETTIGT